MSMHSSLIKEMKKEELSAQTIVRAAKQATAELHKANGDDDKDHLGGNLPSAIRAGSADAERYMYGQKVLAENQRAMAAAGAAMGGNISSPLMMRESKPTFSGKWLIC